MEGVLKSEVFFFIASVALVLVSVVFLVVLAYAIRIFKNLKDISDIAKRESQLLSEDMNNFRTKIKNDGSLWGAARILWNSYIGRRKKRK